MYAEKFRVFGVKKRKDAQCPNCYSLERHRLLWCFLKDKTDLFDGNSKSLLHIAPERLTSKLLAALPNIDYLSVDLDSELAMVKIDLTDIQYPDHSFDVIFCSHVLEHIEDDGKAMSEMYRILGPGGWAAVQVPTYGETTFEDPSVATPEDRLKLFGQKDHVRIYELDIVDRLKTAGFQVEDVLYARELSEEKRTLYAIRDQHIFYCAKS